MSAGAATPVPANRRGAMTVFKTIMTFGLVVVLGGLIWTGVVYLTKEPTPATAVTAEVVAQPAEQAVVAVAPVTAVIGLATGESHREYVQAKGISWDVVEGCVEATAANSRGSKETRQVCAGQPDHQWPPATYYEYVAFGGNAVIRFNR